MSVLTACGSVSVSNTPANNGGSSPTPKLDAVSRTVTIDSPDGVKLVGSLYDSGKPNSAAVLLLHQWQSDRHSYDEFAKKMQAAGFNVLAIDGRGFGESTKKSDGTTVSAGRTDSDVKAMLGDVGAAFDFLAKQENVYPGKIGIVGASYGSSLALIYAADHPQVAAVSLLSPGLDYFGNMATEPAISKMGDRSVLFIAAEDDPDSAGAAKRLSDIGSRDNFQLTIYPKGGHGTGLFQAKVALEDRLQQFLTSALTTKVLL